jgi:2'-5' RNA ligase
MRGALTAAADVANGAMVALVPSAPDLERLALEGGEPLDQLHLTLVYLGEADQFDETTRQALIDAGRDTALGWDSVEAEAFAPALFNPTGDEPCAVLVCSGAELAEFHETVLADVTEIVDLPDDLGHAPYCAHVALAYFPTDAPTGLVDAIPALIDRVGPMTFDVLRFAFGGEVTDVPLCPAPKDATVSVEVDPAPAPTVASAQREVWDGPLH